MYYDSAFQRHEKNSKKTWSLLKEVAFGSAGRGGITEINVNNEAITDPRLISENFNTFFTNVGMEIFNSVTPTDRLPSSYQTLINNVPLLDLGDTGPVHVHDLFKPL